MSKVTIERLMVKIESVFDEDQFHGFIQYDDGETSIAKRYTDYDKFMEGLNNLYEHKELLEE